MVYSLHLQKKTGNVSKNHFHWEHNSASGSFYGGDKSILHLKIL